MRAVNTYALLPTGLHRHTSGCGALPRNVSRAVDHTRTQQQHGQEHDDESDTHTLRGQLPSRAPAWREEGELLDKEVTLALHRVPELAVVPACADAGDDSYAAETVQARDALALRHEPTAESHVLRVRPALVLGCDQLPIHVQLADQRAALELWEGHFGLYGGDGAVVVDGLGDGGGGLLGGEGRLTSSGRAQHSPRLVRLKQNVLLPVGVRRAAAEGWVARRSVWRRGGRCACGVRRRQAQPREAEQRREVVALERNKELGAKRGQVVTHNQPLALDTGRVAADLAASNAAAREAAGVHLAEQVLAQVRNVEAAAHVLYRNVANDAVQTDPRMNPRFDLHEQLEHVLHRVRHVEAFLEPALDHRPRHHLRRVDLPLVSLQRRVCQHPLEHARVLFD
mmetsp:Transcript_11263/g.24299  ORF Transcript_11263/g.24299 Transcript_11263/m.24299 type:complete len:397 (+) Transcript_11263:100-1290(+)